MKKPVVDYKQFRLSRLCEQQFSHLKLLFGWVVYFVLYFLTENLIPAETCHPVRCFLDDRIPFCEYFVIPYVLWYVWIAASLLIFALYDMESFCRLQKYFILIQILAITIYIIWPTRQDLRPVTFPRNNLFAGIVSLLYAVDTNTGVCPSLHCACSAAMASVWGKRKESSGWLKVCMVFAAAAVCSSTVFIKQHSVVDVFAAFVICIPAEYLVFHKYR